MHQSGGAPMDRTPNPIAWDIPEVEIWQAIALSLNIDPDKVKYSRLSENPYEDEGEVFWARLRATRAHLDYGLRCCGIIVGEPFRARVSLREFATWAHNRGWELPEFLRAMAAKSAPASVPDAPRARGPKPTTGLIVEEFARLVSLKQVNGASLSAQARELWQWETRAYPKETRPDEPTIRKATPGA